MKPNIRACIAYVAGSLISNRSFAAVRDESEDKNYEMGGKIFLGNIDVLDRESDKMIVGMVSGKDASFYHSGENITITLKLNGTLFTGHDGGTDRDFSGSVVGKKVKIYDYSEGAHIYFDLIEK